MIITISEGSNDSHIRLHCKDKRFVKEWGDEVDCRASGIYKNLALISSWANNTYHEECLFEID